MGVGFGVNFDDYQFGDASAPPDYEDPNASFLEKAKRAMEARRMVEAGMGQETPPEAITIPRVKNMAENPTFFQKNPGGARAIDIAAATAAAISNIRAIKKHKASGGRGRLDLIDFTKFPSIYRQQGARTAAQNKNEQEVQEQNSRIAEAESRINTNAMSRYATRQAAYMGQMTPHIFKAALREPPRERADPALKQRIDAVREFAKRNNWTPKQLNEAELRIIAGDVRTPEEKAQQAMEAQIKVMEATDNYRKTNPKPGSGMDATERNRQVAARYVAELIYNDYEDPTKAGQKGLEMFRQLQGNLGPGATGRPGSMGPVIGGSSTLAPPPPAPVGATGPMRVKANAGAMSPSLADKMMVYVKQIAQNPQRRAEIRERIMREENVDPDLFLEPGQ